MSRRLLATGLAALATSGLLLVLGHPAGAGSSSRLTVSPTRDAWYATSQLCGIPVTCGSGATTGTAYPAGTLHVGMVSGQETARAYLSFAPDAVPSGSTVLDAQLVVPLDSAAGTNAPDIAALQVCLVPGGLPSPTPSTAPTADCSVSSPASYFPGSPATFVADLGPLLARTGGSLDGMTVALVPTPPSTTATLTTTWHVAFSSAARHDANTARAEADVAVAPVEQRPLDQAPPPGVPAPAAPPALPSISAAQPPPPAVEPPQPVALAPDPQVLRPQSFVIHGHRYGVLWAMPFGLFVLGWALVSAYNRDLRTYAVPDRRSPRG